MNLISITNLKSADKNGDIHQDLFSFLGQNFQQIQLTFSNQGYKLPTLTSAQIATLDPSKNPNVLLINSDTNQLIVNLGGTFKVVQVV